MADQTHPIGGAAPDPRRLSRPEFVAMMAAAFALVAFSTDAMLPAFPAMSAELTPDAPNRVGLVVAAFIAALGLGTFIAGPLADAYGRKPVVIGGVAIFVVGSLIAFVANSLEMLLVGRFLQGLGASGPRIAPLAMVRDLYKGRAMAQITSFIMTVFMLVPAAAPYVGAMITDHFGWRAIFIGFILFSVLGMSWITIRQPETLPPDRRNPLRVPALMRAAREVFGDRDVMLYLVILSLVFGELLAVVSSVQPVYDSFFDKADSFPMWFALGALIATTGTITNATLVTRLGMRRLALAAITAKMAYSVLTLGLILSGAVHGALLFAIWFIWSSSNFFAIGLIAGNLNALALRPLGHIAGTASSILTGVSTVGAALLAVPIALAFNGTPIPLIVGNLCLSFLAFLLMRRTLDKPEDD